MCVLQCRFPWIVVGILDTGCEFQMSTSFCGAAVFKLKRMVGVVWKNLIIFHCFLWPDVSLSFGELFQG